jgi:hypothetical protein
MNNRPPSNARLIDVKFFYPVEAALEAATGLETNEHAVALAKASQDLAAAEIALQRARNTSEEAAARARIRFARADINKLTALILGQ